MNTTNPSTRKKQGFTIIELTIAAFIMVMAVAGALSLFVVIQNSWTTASLHMRSSSNASRAISRMVYGAGSDRVGIRAAYRAGVELDQTVNGGWELSLSTNITETIQYVPANSNIVTQSGFVIADNVVTSSANMVSGGCRISLTVQETGRGRQATSTMSTYVKFRNNEP